MTSQKIQTQPYDSEIQTPRRLHGLSIASIIIHSSLALISDPTSRPFEFIIHPPNPRLVFIMETPNATSRPSGTLRVSIDSNDIRRSEQLHVTVTPPTPVVHRQPRHSPHPVHRPTALLSHSRPLISKNIQLNPPYAIGDLIQHPYFPEPLVFLGLSSKSVGTNERGEPLYWAEFRIPGSPPQIYRKLVPAWFLKDRLPRRGMWDWIREFPWIC